ncbi:MAG: hypothetical protein J6U23_11990 [Clostridiales bacterium]|nr:hypothetical protein [Clostridiales bacterium]
MLGREMKSNSLISKIMFIIFVELYSLLASFIGIPLLSSHVASWIWISLLSVYLIGGHFLACYVLRRESPFLWLYGIPVNIVFICMLSNIDDPFFVRSLALYGIVSKFNVDQDKLITFIPYYLDALIYAVLIAAGRIMFATPTYYIAKSNRLSYEET